MIPAMWANLNGSNKLKTGRNFDSAVVGQSASDGGEGRTGLLDVAQA